MSVIKGLLDRFYPPTQKRVLLLGNDASGKTTILYRLTLGEVVTTIPTIGFNVENMTKRRMDISLWDIGGCDKIRPLWRHYYTGTDMIIYVISADDSERFSAQGKNGNSNLYDLVYSDLGLKALLKEECLENAAIFILINKIDLPNTPTMSEVADLVGINEIFEEDRMN